MLRLISATPSPYARKVRIALAEKNIPFELITEVPWNQGAITEQHNPLAKLPVLILEDGSSIFDSRFILDTRASKEVFGGWACSVMSIFSRTQSVGKIRKRPQLRSL